MHTTNAGTKGIVNAKAIAEYIKVKEPKEVSLVCMGLDALKETEEDSLCAYYIKSLLENKNVNIDNEISKLKNPSGAKLLKMKNIIC